MLTIFWIAFRTTWTQQRDKNDFRITIKSINSVVSVSCSHWANWLAERMILSALFALLEESFCYKYLCSVRKFSLSMKISCPPAENIYQTLQIVNYDNALQPIKSGHIWHKCCWARRLGRRRLVSLANNKVITRWGSTRSNEIEFPNEFTHHRFPLWQAAVQWIWLVCLSGQLPAVNQ